MTRSDLSEIPANSDQTLAELLTPVELEPRFELVVLANVEMEEASACGQQGCNCGVQECCGGIVIGWTK